jgi:solute:Na+ symporter, SSS family
MDPVLLNIPLESHFGILDAAVLLGYLILTTVIGHRLSGKQSTIKDFFLAGRSLPWPAVSGSIIATEISAVTFIGVPGIVFAANGNFTYLQWAIGSIIARGIVGVYFVKAFYENEIYSPYDFVANRLGAGAKKITTLLFMIGSILGQSVRVLVPALVLRSVTPLDMVQSIVVIVVFGVIWTWMGGMTTVIWTDVIQFGLFLFAGILAFVWILFSLPQGFGQFVEVAGAAGKFEMWRWLPGVSDEKDFLLWVRDTEFTMWTALLAVPFLNLAAFGTDQLNAQRMFCCRNASDAKKAIIFSSLGQIATLMMLLVGAALFAYYAQFTPTPEIAAKFKADADLVFPIWITTALPAGLTGLVLAGAFAAAISSLDSALAALSQTSISLWYHGRKESDMPPPERLVKISRLTVVAWAIFLGLMTIVLYQLKERANLQLLSLAFGMVAYTYGSLLAIFLLALWRIPARMKGLWVGLIISILVTTWVRGDIFVVLSGIEGWSDLKDWHKTYRLPMIYVWLYPLNFAITFFCGWLSARGQPARPEYVAP